MLQVSVRVQFKPKATTGVLAAMDKGVLEATSLDGNLVIEMRASDAFEDLVPNKPSRDNGKGSEPSHTIGNIIRLGAGIPYAWCAPLSLSFPPLFC